MQNNNMLLYNQHDIQIVMGFLDSLTVTGVNASRKLSTVATILEAGRPLDNYIKEEGKTDGNIREELHSDDVEG